MSNNNENLPGPGTIEEWEALEATPIADANTRDLEITHPEHITPDNLVEVAKIKAANGMGQTAPKRVHSPSTPSFLEVYNQHRDIVQGEKK